MAEYIDKNALYKKIAELEEVTRIRYLNAPKNSPVCSRFIEQLDERTRFKHMVEDFPPVDVAPVKHGKWVWNPDGMDWGLGAWKCSECACRNNNLGMNSKMNPLMFSGSKYCPNCGARMDLEE